MSKTQIEIHPIQAGILMELLFRQEARFGQLNSNKTPTDHFNFHLQQLVKQKLVEKNARGKYTLSREGKEFANRFDSEAAQVERQAKLGAIIVCQRKKGTCFEYLLQERKKQPYFGFVGFVSGKIRWGESILTAAARELKEETGFEGDLNYKGTAHLREYDKKGLLLEDKFFFVVLAQNLKGELVEEFQGGRNFWCSKSEFFKLEKLFQGDKEMLEIALGNKTCLVELVFEVEEY